MHEWNFVPLSSLILSLVKLKMKLIMMILKDGIGELISEIELKIILKTIWSIQYGCFMRVGEVQRFD